MQSNRENQAEALLNHVNRYQAGRLTVFLGAAPGVGKTYAMLARAKELFQQGTDVVVGIVETHGRIETLKILEGLPQIARKEMQYQGHILEEMDLDAILLRHPQIVLVDELAHRNVPNSRHERRWQDVNELLDAGIDVFTAINIQHLESLNDVVYQITGIRVNETVPDRVFDRIRDIRLIDLPVSELIERLHQGKVYVPEQANLALQGFFSISNLTALRELAMQCVAEHVDSDLKESYVSKGLKSISLQNELMIAIDGQGSSEYLVRAGCRLAERNGATWTVVNVAKSLDFGQSSRNSYKKEYIEIDRAFELARQLGGRTEVLYGPRVASVLMDAAVDRGISNLVIGKSISPWWLKLFKKNLAQQLLNQENSMALTILHPEQGTKKINQPEKPSFLSLKESVFVLAVTCASIFIAHFAEVLFGIEDFSVIFIISVLIVATKTRMLAAVVAALICFLAYNFFFIAPRYTFQISAHQGVVTVVAFFAAALIAGRLASQLRQQVLSLKAANAYTTVMQDLARKLSSAVNLEEVMQTGRITLETQLQTKVWISIRDKIISSDIELNDKEKVAAEWCLKHQQPCGRFTDTLSQSNWWFLPLLEQKNSLGIVGIYFKDEVVSLNFEQKKLTESVIEYIAQAVLRTQLVNELEQAKVTSETERLRSALLSSVSHDLRSPLASIIGAADTLANFKAEMTEQDQQDLLETIHLEGERLDRYIQNLLDMTRLGHEGLTLKRDWIGVDELIGSATRRLKRYKPDTQVVVQLPEQPISLYVHPALVEQAIFNVLENAANFSPPDEPVMIRTHLVSEDEVKIEIEDKGAGIPEDERHRIFDMFYTMERGDRGKFGTGLGLTIVKAIIGAHMGTIEAFSGRQNKGTLIQIKLPLHPVKE
ncbi:histidine kinase [Acinetobacter baumannii]|nr:histidine kinase [Acinetobacter baumannii]